MYNTHVQTHYCYTINESTVLLINTSNHPTVPLTYLGQIPFPCHRPRQRHVEAAIDFIQHFGFGDVLADGTQRFSKQGNSTLSLFNCHTFPQLRGYTIIQTPDTWYRWQHASYIQQHKLLPPQMHWHFFQGYGSKG